MELEISCLILKDLKTGDPKITVDLKCIPLMMIKKRNRPKKYQLEYTKQRKNTNNFMPQRLSNRTQTSKINFAFLTYHVKILF